jgi:predicted amidophosphoribosyltransferase
MTHAIRIDPKHFAVAGGFCPSCGARRDELRPCGECGEERTWAQAHYAAIVRGDAARAAIAQKPEGGAK